MVLDFGNDLFKGDARINFMGPQFEQEATRTIIITYVFGGTGEETIYTVPAGKNLFVTKIMMINIESIARGWELKVNDNLIFKKSVTAGNTAEIDFPSPMVIGSTGTLKGKSNDAGSSIAIIGWEL